MTALLAGSTLHFGFAAGAVSFNRDVRPILADHCLNCHGQDEKTRKGGLRLDEAEEALKGGKSGRPAIVPGKPEESELWKRVKSHDPDEVMPPGDQKNPVSEAQVAILQEWIREGGKYEGHWAFRPPMRPLIPAHAPVELGEGEKFIPRTAIDAFILSRLEREKLKPSPEAAPEILCRRVYLDLTGLPPAPAEVREFKRLHAEAPEKAYRELVERLLASDAFAEKWARWWLDAARYADSDGYEKDLPRDQWPWRDWVIEAFKKDKPYDQFIVEQLAGDLMPNATQEQRIATGFLRNGMLNEEGAVIAEQFRLEGMFDRMDAVGKSVLGLSIQCAQCHSHKFDPLTHDEYYRMFSFLNNTYESMSWIYEAGQQKKIAEITSQIRMEEQGLLEKFPGSKERFESWVEKASAMKTQWKTFDTIEQGWVGGLSHPEKLPDGSIMTLGFRPTHGELWVTGMLNETNITGLRLEALTHGDLPFNGPGRSHNGSFALAELSMEAAPAGEIGANTNHAEQIKTGLKKIALTDARADLEIPERPLEAPFFKGKDDKRKVGPAKFLVDENEDTAWSADLGPGRRHVDSQVVVRLATNGWAASDGTFVRFWLKYRHGGPDIHGRDNNFLGRFRISYTTEADPHAEVPRSIREILEMPADQRTAGLKEQLFSYWRITVVEFAEVNHRIENLWKKFPTGNSVLNLAERDARWKRETKVLDRGDWQKPSRPVSPGVPAFLHSLPPDARLDRLGFAEWLVDNRSPLTARVVVNRIWQSIFGTGLVETPEDFGVRAAMPMHPELLDWLACELMEPTTAAAPPWSLKQVIRSIVTSASYRQSARATAELLERDPNNRLLARGPRFRVEAEIVRDIALSAAGLLNTSKVGGPSFYPPVPESLFPLTFVKIDWKTAPAPERYRRSLYMFRRRSMPDPVMASLDAPNADFSCVRRPRSNTPLAALTGLNEPVLYQAAQALAWRTVKEGGASDESRAAYAFELCTGRAPTESEQSTIVELLKSREGHIAEGWVPARELAFPEGRTPADLPSGISPKQLAAWTVVSRVLLNLDETISKN